MKSICAALLSLGGTRNGELLLARVKQQKCSLADYGSLNQLSLDQPHRPFKYLSLLTQSDIHCEQIGMWCLVRVRMTKCESYFVRKSKEHYSKTVIDGSHEITIPKSCNCGVSGIVSINNQHQRHLSSIVENLYSISKSFQRICIALGTHSVSHSFVVLDPSAS